MVIRLSSDKVDPVKNSEGRSSLFSESMKSAVIGKKDGKIDSTGSFVEDSKTLDVMDLD